MGCLSALGLGFIILIRLLWESFQEEKAKAYVEAQKKTRNSDKK